MPPAITVSPHLVTPSRTYCTVPTSSSPRLSPSRAHVCPRRKNSNQNGLFSKFRYLTWLLTLWIGGEDGLQVAINEEKSRIVDLAQGEQCSFLGFDFRRVRSRRGVWRAW